MRKITAVLLAIAFLLCGMALADTLGKGSDVARQSELAAFMGNDGYIYISGQQEPVNTTKARSVLSIDPYRIVFFSEDEGLYSLELGTNTETLIIDDVYAACTKDDSAYYVKNSDRFTLMKYDFENESASKAYTATEQIEKLYAAMNGVIITTVENSGAFILDTDTMTTVSYGGEIANEIRRYDDFEAYTTDSNVLYALREGAFFADTVDSDVRAWAVIGEDIYYLTGKDDALQLKSHGVMTGVNRTVCAVPSGFTAQLTASQTKLFMLGTDYKVYTVNTETGAMTRFVTLSDPSSYAVGNSVTLSGYKIEAVSGQLNIYGIKESADSMPTFSFVDFTSDTSSDDDGETMLLSAYVIEGESTVHDLLTPVETEDTLVTLRKGSRGEAVSAIQDPLNEHGYYDYYIDGIFGWRTERGIRLLQEQLGYSITGEASPELQKLIRSGDIPDYDPYMALKRGSNGPRVREMQLKLRKLGYLADAADGYFGVRTEKAVTLFQSENGLDDTGIADEETLNLLFSDKASECSCYIDLERGDSGWRVRELNERLQDLYYLEGSAGETYTSKTAAAIRKFQEQVGLRVTGRATAAVQQKLFSGKAPEYDGYITLSRGDDNDRVEEMQERLRELGYFDGKCNGYFGKKTEEAVRKFQRQDGLHVTGIADPDTLEEMFDPNAPHYKAYEDISDPYIDLSDYSYIADDIYYIADEDTTEGCVTASYFADGDVDSYDILVTDDEGTVYAEAEYTDETVVLIPVASLDTDRIYTIAVTAHPEDPNADDTYASIQFVHTYEEPEPDPEEIGTIDSLVIAPDYDTQYSYENGVYVMEQSQMRFSWEATGDVVGYSWEVSDEDDNILASETTVVETTSYDASGLALSENTIYTLMVYAIPENGTIDDATMDSINFRLKTTVDEMIEEENEELTAEEAEAESKNTEDSLPENSEQPSEDNPETEITPEPTQEAVWEDAEVTAEMDTEAEVTETPEPEVQTIEVGTPVITIDPAVNTFMGNYDGGEVETIEPAAGTFVIAWPAEGDAAVYDVKITDSNGNVRVDEQNTAYTASSLSTDNLTPGEVYYIEVTAKSEDGTSAAVAGLYFGLPADISETEAADTETQETVETADESALEENSVYEENQENADDSDTDSYDENDTAEPEISEETETDTEFEAEENAEDNGEFSEESHAAVEPEVVEEASEVEEEPETDEEPEVEEEPETDEEPEVEEEPETEEEPEVEEEPETDEEPEVEEEPETEEEPEVEEETEVVDIAGVQQALVNAGYLEEGSYQSGILDDATVEALIAYQNDNGLTPCDVDAPYVSDETLFALGL